MILNPDLCVMLNQGGLGVLGLWDLHVLCCWGLCARPNPWVASFPPTLQISLLVLLCLYLLSYSIVVRFKRRREDSCSGKGSVAIFFLFLCNFCSTFISPSNTHACTYRWRGCYCVQNNVSPTCYAHYCCWSVCISPTVPGCVHLLWASASALCYSCRCQSLAMRFSSTTQTATMLSGWTLHS